MKFNKDRDKLLVEVWGLDEDDDGRVVQKARVVVAKEDYESLQETLHLLSSKATSKRLFSALSKIETGDTVNRDLEECLV